MTKPFIAVMIIPTGIGAEIGGHVGDASPAAKLIASVCDKLIVHPNVVNAADINEMTENMLYVEGSTLDRFLEGTINLREVRSNKILVAVNSPVKDETVNAVSAARATLGADIEIVMLDKPLTMKGWVADDKANGSIVGQEELVKQVKAYDFDALAITTPTDVEKEVAIKYWNNGGVNPWGYVEAMMSRFVSEALNKPVAHSPVEADWVIKENYTTGIVDPRISAETVSVCYLHCILKGLHKAPRISHRILQDLHFEDVDVLVSPYGCWGRPHEACEKAGIPIITVIGNEVQNFSDVNIMKCISINSYMEAVGRIQAMKIGVTRESVTRPLKHTVIYNNKKAVVKIPNTDTSSAIKELKDDGEDLSGMFTDDIIGTTRNAW